MTKLIAFFLALLAPFTASGAELFNHKLYNRCDKQLAQTGRQLAQTHDLKLLNRCIGRLVDAKSSYWAYSFTSKAHLTLEEVRPLVKNMIETLQEDLFHYEFFKEYQLYAHAKTPFSVAILGFKLVFWDENVNRPLPPYIAQVRFADGKVYYYYANPKTQGLENPIEESLEDLGVCVIVEEVSAPQT